MSTPTKDMSLNRVIVRGPALTRSGYGEHTARFVLRSLTLHGRPAGKNRSFLYTSRLGPNFLDI